MPQLKARSVFEFGLVDIKFIKREIKMIKNTLHKLSSMCILSVLLYVPAGMAAPITQFSFDATILETSGPSPLNVNDPVGGFLEIDSDDQDGPPYTEPGFAAYSYWGGITGNTFGAASVIPGPGWSQGPSLAVFVGLENDHAITAADLADLPSYVNHASLPPVGSLIDLIEFEVVEYLGTWGAGDHFEIFGAGFAFDAADDVLTGLTMGDVDFTKLFTHAFYTEFFAEYYIDDGSEDGITVWEAFGPLVASPAPVPVPAAVWLFGSGLLGMFGFSRRRAS